MFTCQMCACQMCACQAVEVLLISLPLWLGPSVCNQLLLPMATTELWYLYKFIQSAYIDNENNKLNNAAVAWHFVSSLQVCLAVKTK